MPPLIVKAAKDAAPGVRQIILNKLGGDEALAVTSRMIGFQEVAAIISKNTRFD